MANEKILWKLEGLHTVETVAETLGIGRQSAINLLTKLKKKGYVTTSGGGKQKRLYKVTMKKQRKRSLGMFDIINKYSPMKVNEWYDHQVHGKYGPEEALVDAVQTQSFRLILASLKLFNHITDWKKLYDLANKKGVWQQIGALYDVARLNLKTRKMPQKYVRLNFKKWSTLTQLRNRNNYPKIEHKWKVHIPFNQKDVREIK